MPADDYTPTTEQVRRAYVTGMRQAFIASAGEHSAEFDRFLARVRAEAGAQALRDAAEDVVASRGYGLQYPDGNRFDIGSDTADGIGDWLRLRADTITQEASSHPEGARVPCGCDLTGTTPPAVHIVDGHEGR